MFSPICMRSLATIGDEIMQARRHDFKSGGYKYYLEREERWKLLEKEINIII